MDRILFIGDVHGCIDELESLWRVLGPGAGDRVVLVGDLVAKGPDSQAVVQFARERGCLAVRGNHDERVLRWWREPETRDGFKPDHARVAQSLTEADRAYLEGLPFLQRFAAAGCVAVHGGLVPGIAYESQDPKWLVNLRSIRADGTPSKKVDEGTAWAKVWPGPEHAVFGHDAIRGLQQERHATGLDTGCVYGRRLTALEWPSRRLVHVDARRPYAALK